MGIIRTRRSFLGTTAAAAFGVLGSGVGTARAGSTEAADNPFDFAEEFPRVPMFVTPTPIEHLKRLSAHLAGPQIYVKRDDTTTLGFGGNKVRKLEFLLADAQAKGADTLVTVGGIQSNHCRQTAAVAAKFGMACELVLAKGANADSRLFMSSGNVLLNRLYGARMNVVAEGASSADVLTAVEARVRSAGGRPYMIGSGGSSPIGALGYRRAARELLKQLQLLEISPRAIYHSTGSAGTQSGLLFGLAEQQSRIPVMGISSGVSAKDGRERIANLLGGLKELLKKPDVEAGAINVDDGYVGPAYGVLTDAGLEAIELCARLEGLLLDPTYTGKAMAGLIDHVRQGKYSKTDTVVFLHTGGTPEIFAYERFAVPVG